MKMFSLNLIIVVVMCLSAAVGGVLIGLNCSEKSFLDLIWVLEK